MKRKLMPKYGIKGKLISALCMLLVALIMVVSSTYAWFTLSTAPEVKGISTAIGANGALEIRLNGASTDPNASYGNLVDLSTGYGLDQITLLPSALHLDDNGKINNQFLNIPQYGANGKVMTELSGNRTEAGTLKGNAFVAGSDTGVRAVGVASGLTDRQLAYRNAKYAAATNSSLATNAAASSLNTNGAVLGNIVIKKATDGDDATYTPAEITSLQNIVNDLQGVEGKTGVLDYIESAYEQMIIAYAASAKLDAVAGSDVTLADAIYSTVKAKFADGNLTLDNIVADKAIKVTIDTNTYSFDLKDNPILTALEALAETKSHVAAAQTALDTLNATPKTEYTWGDVSGVLTYLIDTANVTVNDQTAADIKDDMNGFISSAMANGINIELKPGAGVYAEIADQCGNYSATVTMTNFEVKGIPFDKLTANMATKSVLPKSYLELAQAAVADAGEPTGETNTAMPMTEFYGYIIDLIFRTNAANSDLLLQTEATDRIYEDNTNEATQGGGSSMTFKSASASFTTEQVKGLMEAIRVVFFDTDSHEVLAYARLDMENATVGVDGVTAKLYLYQTVDVYTYTYTAEGATEATTETYYVVEADGNYTYYSDEDLTNDVTANVVANFADAATAVPASFDEGTAMHVALTEDDAVITAMAQNQEVKVSTLVYLDGETLGNEDVAATDPQSVTGNMNLQFSSSADLTPMEYGDLHITGNESETTETTETN